MSRHSRRPPPPPPPRGGSGLVAWVALLLSLVALGVSLSDKAWVRDMAARYEQNWDTLVSSVGRSLNRNPGGGDAVELVQGASRSAREEQTPEARRQLREAARSLRTRAERLTGNARRVMSDLASEVEAQSARIEAGAESARTLASLAVRVEAALRGVPSSPER